MELLNYLFVPHCTWDCNRKGCGRKSEQSSVKRDVMNEWKL